MMTWIAGRRCVFLAVLGMIAFAVPMRGQEAPKPLTYEVASIRPYDPGSDRPGMMLMFKTDGVSVSGMSLRSLIKFAYNLNLDEQVVGCGPIGDKRFVIEAKMDADTVAAMAKLPLEDRQAQQRKMLETLLADRFKLKAHPDNKEMSHYEITVAKSGLKLKEDVSNDKPEDGAGEAKDAKPALRAGGMMIDDHGRLEGRTVSIASLANILSMLLHQKVEDKSGLTGKYNFTLKWTPDDRAQSDAAATDSGPSIYTAVQEQLGLKLDAVKGPVDTVVVDHLEMPSEN